VFSEIGLGAREKRFVHRVKDSFIKRSHPMWHLWIDFMLSAVGAALLGFAIIVWKLNHLTSGSKNLD
jgi:hypothetical protein